MSNITGTIRAKSASATTPTIYNVSMPVAGTEYSQVLSDGTKRFTVRMRTPANAKIAFVSGDTAVKWILIPGGNSLSEENLDLTGVTIYMQSTAAGQVAEILEWT